MYTHFNSIPDSSPRILALVGSNNSVSIHRQLVESLPNLWPEARFEVVDMLPFDEIPLYSPRREKQNGTPSEISEFYDSLQKYDAVVVASPEYNGSMPAVFKNFIDWISRIKMRFFGDLPVLLLSTSPGPNGGATNLKQMAQLVTWWGAQPVGHLSLGRFYERFAEGRPNAETRSELETQLFALRDALSRQPAQAA